MTLSNIIQLASKYEEIGSIIETISKYNSKIESSLLKSNKEKYSIELQRYIDKYQTIKENKSKIFKQSEGKEGFIYVLHPKLREIIKTGEENVKKYNPNYKSTKEVMENILDSIYKQLDKK